MGSPLTGSSLGLFEPLDNSGAVCDRRIKGCSYPHGFGSAVASSTAYGVQRDAAI